MPLSKGHKNDFALSEFVTVKVVKLAILVSRPHFFGVSRFMLYYTWSLFHNLDHIYMLNFGDTFAFSAVLCVYVQPSYVGRLTVVVV